MRCSAPDWAHMFDHMVSSGVLVGCSLPGGVETLLLGTLKDSCYSARSQLSLPPCLCSAPMDTNMKPYTQVIVPFISCLGHDAFVTPTEKERIC